MVDSKEQQHPDTTGPMHSGCTETQTRVPALRRVRKLWAVSTQGTRNVQHSGLPLQGERHMTCFCPEGRNNVSHSWWSPPCRLPQTHVYLCQSAVCPPCHPHGDHFYPEPASSVNPGNLSVGKMLLVLYESLHVAIS